MRIGLISAALPPRLDGIGDYTARLAVELAHENHVTVWTGADGPVDPLPGVTIRPSFQPLRPASCRRLCRAVQAEPPDWLVLQYSPFSFGPRGFNLHLPLALRGLRRRCPGLRQAIMVHEPFVPSTSLKFRMMATYQRLQLALLGRGADLVSFSVERWAARYRHWFPGRRVAHLPVGSCIPDTGRGEGAVPPTRGVTLGFFGTAHASRLLDYTAAAASAVREAGHLRGVLYLGPDAAAVRGSLAGLPLETPGALPGPEVSCRLREIDLYLAPFVDGVSTRRTSLMAALQHGRAVLGTRGELTDSILARRHGSALVLTDAGDIGRFAAAAVELAARRSERERLGEAAESLYRREFDWPVIAGRLRSLLEGEPPPAGGAEP